MTLRNFVFYFTSFASFFRYLPVTHPFISPIPLFLLSFSTFSFFSAHLLSPFPFFIFSLLSFRSYFFFIPKFFHVFLTTFHFFLPLHSCSLLSLFLPCHFYLLSYFLFLSSFIPFLSSSFSYFSFRFSLSSLPFIPSFYLPFLIFLPLLYHFHLHSFYICLPLPLPFRLNFISFYICLPFLILSLSFDFLPSLLSIPPPPPLFFPSMSYHTAFPYFFLCVLTFLP